MPIKIVPSVCCHDCGGSCPLNLFVENGRIIKIQAHDLGLPAFKPCARGLLYHYRVYSPERVKYPMKRVGERGEGKFRRISWDDALDEVVSIITETRDKHGSASILSIPWSGPDARLHNATVQTRFFNLAGGHTRPWGGASNQGGLFASLAMYGRVDTGNERADLLNSKMIILWGIDPAQKVFGTETRWYLSQAKEKGIRIVCVDPRYTDTCSALSAEWIPIRPGTDAAMLVAMAYQMITENIYDRSFVDKYTIGFDKYRDYVMGKEDGVPKTPGWAEKICLVPAEKISSLAHEYATTKPAALMPGWGPGRTSRGEQYHRAAAVLAAMTGNVGISGGSTACLDVMMGAGPREGFEATTIYTDAYTDLPPLINPVEQNAPLHEFAVNGIRFHTATSVNGTKLWDAILRGKAGGYHTDFKLVYIMGGNALNQMPDSNRGAEALKKVEHVVVHEQFITPSARYADILLPACTWCERNDIKLPWLFGHYAMFANKAIEPLYESRSDLDIFSELAHRLGITEYSDKTEDDWLRFAAAAHGITEYEDFKKSGFYKTKTAEPYVAFREQIKDIARAPFPTPSGKIEIYSQRIADYGHEDVLPALPKYLEGWEGPGDPKFPQYPLQLLTVHPSRRIHSQHDNVSWYKRRQPREVWINPRDAETRGIKNNQQVLVYNNRGAVSISAKVTHRIIPGAVCIFEGAWYKPDENGVDRGGCANVLTRGEHSPGGAFTSNTALVQIRREG